MAQYNVVGTMMVHFEKMVEADDQDEAEELVEEMEYDDIVETSNKVTFDFLSTDEVGG